MDIEDRMARAENIITLLVENARRVDDRMDALTAAQANSEAKIAALADAQINTEAALAKLAEQMAELALAHAHTDQRLDALIDIVRERRNGKPE